MMDLAIASLFDNIICFVKSIDQIKGKIWFCFPPNFKIDAEAMQKYTKDWDLRNEYYPGMTEYGAVTHGHLKYQEIGVTLIDNLIFDYIFQKVSKKFVEDHHFFHYGISITFKQ
jgi:hypothetical protein